jgi:hypothetical protein
MRGVVALFGRLSFRTSTVRSALVTRFAQILCISSNWFGGHRQPSSCRAVSRPNVIPLGPAIHRLGELWEPSIYSGPRVSLDGSVKRQCNTPSSTVRWTRTKVEVVSLPLTWKPCSAESYSQLSSLLSFSPWLLCARGALALIPSMS